MLADFKCFFTCPVTIHIDPLLWFSVLLLPCVRRRKLSRDVQNEGRNEHKVQTKAPSISGFRVEYKWALKLHTKT